MINLEEDKFSLSEQLRGLQTRFVTISNLLNFKANLFEESELMNQAIKAELKTERLINQQLQLKVLQMDCLLKEANQKLDHSIELPDCVHKLLPWIDINSLITSLITSLNLFSKYNQK